MTKSLTNLAKLKMQHKIEHHHIARSLILLVLLSLNGCSTTEIAPEPISKISQPNYLEASHPEGFDIEDVKILIESKNAPDTDSLKDCDADFLKLKEATAASKNEEDFKTGTLELIQKNPVKYHWCFYQQILDLENNLKRQSYIEEKQKSVLKTYEFLAPVARAFMKEFHETRYLRWAIRHYRQLSTWIFFQKLDQSPKTTEELVEANNPFGLWREPSNETQKKSVLEKYQIEPQHDPETEPSPAE